jgi:thioester reductase-like protein
MTVLLMTGFPGSSGSALLPRLLARRDGVRAICVVQVHHLQTAASGWTHRGGPPHVAGRTELVVGDITAPDLGIDPRPSEELDEVTEVWHLAAVYDLTVAEEVARRVNVDGTAEVLRVLRRAARPPRLQYVSTCYVSGRYDGEFTEDMPSTRARRSTTTTSPPSTRPRCWCARR